MKFDSLQDYEFRNDEWAIRERETTQQPAPDVGEWRVEAMPTHGWRVVDATGQEIVADVYRKEDAVQIVADRHAAQMQAGLVEALREILAEAEFVGDAKQPFSTWIAEKVRAALKAAGGR